MHAASGTSTPHSSERSHKFVQLFGSPEVVPGVIPLDSDSPAVPLELVEVEVGVAVEVDMEVVVSPSVALPVAPPLHAANTSEPTIAARAPCLIAQPSMPPTVPQPIAQAVDRCEEAVHARMAPLRIAGQTAQDLETQPGRDVAPWRVRW